MKTLVFLSGPPAVGKMAVGQEISRLTGMPLFHNHLSIEAILPVFDFGQPAFDRLVTRLRRDVLEEVAESELPGVVFTYVWAFDSPGDLEYVKAMSDIFRSRGERVVYPELWADLDTRLKRNEAASRLQAKASKSDVETSRQHLLDVERRHRLTSGGDFPLSPHLLIDNSHLEPLAAAELIVRHFELPVTPQE